MRSSFSRKLCPSVHVGGQNHLEGHFPRDAQRAEEGGEDSLSYGLQRLGSG